MFGLFGENESGAALIGAVRRVVSKGRGGRRWDTLPDFDLNLNIMVRHLLRAESFSRDFGANCCLAAGGLCVT